MAQLEPNLLAEGVSRFLARAQNQADYHAIRLHDQEIKTLSKTIATLQADHNAIVLLGQEIKTLKEIISRCAAEKARTDGYDPATFVGLVEDIKASQEEFITLQQKRVIILEGRLAEEEKSRTRVEIMARDLNARLKVLETAHTGRRAMDLSGIPYSL